MKTLIMLSALMLLPQLAEAAGEKHSVSCNREKKKQTHKLEVGKKDVVYMISGSNASTGYKWVSREDLKSEYVNTSPALGGGGVEGFEIKVSKIRGDRAEYVFEYKRPWESDKKPESICTIELTIE